MSKYEGGAYCMKCMKNCVYAPNRFGGMSWVHADTGQHMSNELERHDCNTYIEPKRGH